MADTASLVARVKTEGAKQAAAELDALAKAGYNANFALDETPKAATQAGNAANTAAKGGFKNLGFGAQQVGFQVQDMVVQLQAGTSAFVAIGQQGSQLAGAFGPGGAVLGAVIALASAVGGVLYNSLNQGKSSLDDVQKGATELAKSFQMSKAGTLEFSDALVAIATSGDAAYGSMIKLLSLQAEQQIAKATSAVKEQSTAWLDNSVNSQTNIATLDDLIAKNADVGKVLSEVNVMTDANSAKYGNLAVAVKEMADEYGISTQAVSELLVAQRQFNAEPTAANAQKVADATTRAAQAATQNKDEILDQAVATQQLAQQLGTATKQLDLTTAAQKRTADATNSTTQRLKEQNDQIIRNQEAQALSGKARLEAQAKADKEAFAAREGVTKEQNARFVAARDKELAKELAQFDAAEKKKTDRIAAAADRRDKAQARREETAAERQKKAADTFLAQIDRTSGDEIARITATEQQKLEKLQMFNQQGLIVGQEFEQAKTDIQLAAEDARQKELEKRRNTEARQQNEHDQFIANIQALNATEIEMIDAQNAAKLAKAKEMHDKGRISEQEYQDSIRAIQENTEKKKEEVQLAALSDMTSNLKTALGEGNALYKAAAITQTIIDTYKGATAAYSAFAGIPIVGPALGAAAAGAAIAAGLARVSAIRSAREQGGNLAPGQVSTIAERGKPEVIMPAGASRVRTAQQMRQIMGENSGGAGGDSNIVIVNQTTGRIDSVQQDRDDEGRLRVIIRELVSGDLQDSNSDISKSRRSTRGQPGH